MNTHAHSWYANLEYTISAKAKTSHARAHAHHDSDIGWLEHLIGGFARGDPGYAPWCASDRARTQGYSHQLSTTPTSSFVAYGPFNSHENMYKAIMTHLRSNIQTMSALCQHTMYESYLQSTLETRDWVVFASFTLLHKTGGFVRGDASRCLHMAGVVFAKQVVDAETRQPYFFIDLLCAQVDGKGIGKSLVQKATLHALTSGCAWIELHSVHDKVAYYEKMGFESTGVTIANDDNIPLLKMRRMFSDGASTPQTPSTLPMQWGDRRSRTMVRYSPSPRDVST